MTAIKEEPAPPTPFPATETFSTGLHRNTIDMTPPTDPVRIELPETATLPSVRAMTLDLLHAFETGSSRIVLDASSVQRVDTAAMQSLASACRSARDLEIEILIEAPSEAFDTAARRLGLAHEDALPLSRTQGA